MKKLATYLAFVSAVLISTRVFCQGFVNLDFEHPILPLNPVATYYIAASNGIPGWTPYYITSTATNSSDVISYNTVSLGGAAIILEDTNNISPSPLQGVYSVFLFGASAISQTGQVPVTAQSLTFLNQLAFPFQVTFNGQPLNYFISASNPNYHTYTADISAFAGQTGELRFIAPAGSGIFLDDIQFSSLPAPEPSVLALSALGGMFLGWRAWKKSPP